MGGFIVLLVLKFVVWFELGVPFVVMLGGNTIPPPPPPPPPDEGGGLGCSVAGGVVQFWLNELLPVHSEAMPQAQLQLLV